MTKKVLIVGGAGYIGSHLLKEIRTCGYETLVFDSLVYGHKEAVLDSDLVVSDLACTKKLDEVFSSNKIDAVFHFAAFTYVGESVQNPSKYYKNNVSNTLNLLEACVKHNVKKFVFSSTCAIFGNPKKLPLDENHSKNPINPYGKSKLMIEEILSDFSKAYGINYAALRYFNAAGADKSALIGESHDPETHLIPLVLKTVLGKLDSIKVFGTDFDTKDGTAIRDYIHVTDLADAHIKALEYIFDTNQNLKLNLGTGKGYSVKEIIETAEKVTNTSVKAILTDRREGDPAILVADNSKAKEILNWSAKNSDIEQIIKDAYRWEQTKRF